MSYIFDALNRHSNNDKSGEQPDIHTSHEDVVFENPDSALSNTQATIADDDTITPPTLDPEDAPGPFKFDESSHLINTESLINDDRLVAISEPSSIMSEEYRSIRTSMLARWDHKRHLVHTITSATPQEGKTITALNLGFTFAELKNRRTVVVEADLRLPNFNSMISLPHQPGLVGLLEGQANLSQAVHRLANDRLHLITAGRRVNNKRAVQLLSSTAMARLIETLRKTYDHVIIDTPPVIKLADAGILGSKSDEVLLVVRMNRTPKPLVDQALRTLNNYNIAVGGLIATDHQRSGNRYYGYNYGYSYGGKSGMTAKQAA